MFTVVLCRAGGRGVQRALAGVGAQATLDAAVRRDYPRPDRRHNVPCCGSDPGRTLQHPEDVRQAGCCDQPVSPRQVPTASVTFKSEAEPEHASCVGVTGVDEVYTAELKCSSTAPLSVAFAAAVRALTLHHSARIWMKRTVLTLWHLQVALTVANCVNSTSPCTASPRASA